MRGRPSGHDHEKDGLHPQGPTGDWKLSTYAHAQVHARLIAATLFATLIADCGDSAAPPTSTPLPLRLSPRGFSDARGAGSSGFKIRACSGPEYGIVMNSACWTARFAAWVLALVATAGALFMGEVMGMTPCVLCWYQRIAMFPLVVVLGLGLLEAGNRSVRYALPLTATGWAIALYHCLVFWGLVTEALTPCGKGGSCADADVQVAGFVPIPLLSLAAFTVIGMLLWWSKKEDTKT